MDLTVQRHHKAEKNRVGGDGGEDLAETDCCLERLCWGFFLIFQEWRGKEGQFNGDTKA